MTEHRTFLLAGGGTAGHLFPGMAVGEELLRRLPSARILFAGTDREVEHSLFCHSGYDHVALSSPPSTLLRRRPFRFLFQYRQALQDAAGLIRNCTPSVVIGLGGFASVPVVTMAKRHGVPVVLLEQNAVAGRATHRLSRLADRICHAFAEAVPPGRKGRRCIVTGNPVRRAIAALATRNPQRPMDDNHPVTLLVVGGSQGSVAVNAAVLTALEHLRDELQTWRVVHQTGPHNRSQVIAEYERLGIDYVVQPFFADLSAWYATADVVVSRAGATTLAELACVGVPAVLLPYPQAVRDHQRRNAAVFADAGAAVVVEQQRELTATGLQLAEVLRRLLQNSGERRRRSSAMRRLARPDAAERVTVEVLQTAGLMEYHAGDVQTA